MAWREKERRPDSCPLRELGLFFGALSDSFLSHDSHPFFDITSYVLSEPYIQASAYLPPHPLSDLTLFAPFLTSLVECGPNTPPSLSACRSSLSLTHLGASLPGGFAHQLLVIQFTLLQQIQDVLLLHTNTYSTKKKTWGRWEHAAKVLLVDKYGS